MSADLNCPGLVDATRPRLGIALVPSQVRYQLVLLARNPMAPFISIVIPLMLLIALDLVTPEMTLQSLGNVRIVQFLTPAMGSFAILNAGFVNIVIGMTLAREQGTLRRLRSTPLPTWTYLVGRLCAAAIVAALSTAIVLSVGVIFLHAHLSSSAIPPLVGTIAAGFAACCAVGMAASGLIRSAAAALPLSYAVLLPVAFVSQVFFPAPTETAWLHQLASVLPVAPFANAMEAAFSPAPHGLTLSQLAVLLLWAAGGFMFSLIDYRWEPRREPLLRRLAPAIREWIASTISSTRVGKL
jgi:ABC-2 type transport system permease protein